jgi:hypothetical protein
MVLDDDSNPYARPYNCPRCKDFRLLSKSKRFRRDDLVPCDVCGALNHDEYSDFVRRAWAKNNPPPQICELDLSDEELQIFKRWKVENPGTSKATLLAWIEGRRFDPSKDEEFLAEARIKFKEWKHR